MANVADVHRIGRASARDSAGLQLLLIYLIIVIRCSRIILFQLADIADLRKPEGSEAERVPAERDPLAALFGEAAAAALRGDG